MRSLCSIRYCNTVFCYAQSVLLTCMFPVCSTFFKEFHEGLARMVKSLLKYSEGSEAIFLSPKRGDSLDKFLENIMKTGLQYELVEKYDTRVWNLHQNFLKGGDTSWPNYLEDHCYPLLVKITHSS